MDENIKSFIKARKSFLEEEIQLHVETIRSHFEEIENELYEKLNDLFKKFEETNANTSDDLKNLVNTIEFIPNYDYIDINLVGNLSYKKLPVTEFNIKELESSRILQNLNKSSISPRFLAYDSIDDSIYFTDTLVKSLIKLDSDANFRYVCTKPVPFKCPEGLCVAQNEIFVSDIDLNQIFKLNKANFEVINQFGNKHLRKPRGLEYDAQDEQLYVCDYFNRRICIFNKQGQLKNEFSANDTEKEFYPWNLKLSKAHLLVADDWIGGNCIRIFNKRKFSLIQTISHTSLWNPRSIFIDETKENIWTCGNQHYESGSLLLFCFNKNGDLIKQIDLNANFELIDFCFTLKNLNFFFTSDKKLHVYTFN